MTDELPSLAELLPHRGRALLLTRLLDVDWESSTVRAEVALAADAAHAKDGAVPGLLTVEYMAQAAGAFVGLVDRRESSPPAVGFLASVSGAEFHRAEVPLGSTLTVTATLVYSDSTAGRFECAVDLAGACVARASLTVVRTSSDSRLEGTAP